MAYDLSLYYRLFNNDLFQIDLGLTGRRYDGDFNTQHYSYDKDVLMAYTGAEVRIPGTGFAAFGDARAGCRQLRLPSGWLLQVRDRTAQGACRLA